MDIDGAGGALGRRFGYGSAVLLDRLEKLPEAIRSDEKREWCVCVTLYGFKAYGVCVSGRCGIPASEAAVRLWLYADNASGNESGAIIKMRPGEVSVDDGERF